MLSVEMIRNFANISFFSCEAVDGTELIIDITS